MSARLSGACGHAPCRLALALALGLAAMPAVAVQPDEVLADPALEARARALSRELRCVVCQSENIDDSNAAIARDLRLLVRERLAAGDSDADVLAFLVARYGDYVLLNPPARGANWALWLAGPGLLVLAGVSAGAYLRRRGRGSDPAPPLTAEEEARLADLTRE
jgi:cytochrome c-type biogenesis protein CcmH